MRTRVSSLFAALLLAGVLLQARSQGPAPAPAPAQTPAPPASLQEPVREIPPLTFRVQVDYVEVDAFVTDEQGNPVRGLTREDFQVFEDGKPQQVQLFSFVDIPVTRAERPLYSPAPIERDVQTNERFEGRLYVIVLDDTHAAALRSTLVKRAARQFVEQYMGANDIAAVVHLSGRSDASQEFTSNKRLLLAAIDKFMGRKLPTSTLSRLESYQQQVGTSTQQNEADKRIRDPYAFERAYNARSSMDGLENIARYLEGVRGRRKAVVYFSEGIDYDIYDPFFNRDATDVMNAVRDAIAAATRANVAIYTVDPRGLTSLGDEQITQAGSLPQDPAYGITQTSFLDELRLSQDSLRVIADQTGGFAAVNANDFSGAFDRIVKENSIYYVLGYYPTNDKRDGKLRKIEVKVNRPGLVVNARKGYVAPRGKVEPRKVEAAAGTTADLRDALNSPVPESGLLMEMTAAPFKGVAPKASVLVTLQVDGRQFRFVEKGTQFHDNLELSVMAVDTQGKIQGGDRQTIELTLRPETRATVERAGFRLMSRVELPPGRYQLRAGARTSNAGAIGTVYADLEIPDFYKAPFSMSGLVLTSQLAAIVPTARNDEQLKEVLPAPPTTARDFSVADTISVFTEVYDNQGATPHKVDITTSLREEGGREVFKTEEVRGSEELGGARGGFGHVAQVPLGNVAPGLYVLRVEARSRLADTTPAVRETLVRVWPRPQPQAPPSAAASGATTPAKSVVGVARGPQSGVNAFSTTVARTDEEWQGLWKRLPIRREAPKVSFESTMIVAVFLGQRPSSGYGVDIVDVKLDAETLVVEYAERRPPEGSINADVITTPYAVAGVPMYAGQVRFDKVEAPVRP